MKKFFEDFGVTESSISIKPHPQTEFLLAALAPRRIVARRNTAAVDQHVEIHQIVDPAMKPDAETPKAARILQRRNTTAIEKAIDLTSKNCCKPPKNSPPGHLYQPICLNVELENKSSDQQLSEPALAIDLTTKNRIICDKPLNNSPPEEFKENSPPKEVSTQNSVTRAIVSSVLRHTSKLDSHKCASGKQHSGHEGFQNANSKFRYSPNAVR